MNSVKDTVIARMDQLRNEGAMSHEQERVERKEIIDAALQRASLNVMPSDIPLISHYACWPTASSRSSLV